jgi:hypothetical protein
MQHEAMDRKSLAQQTAKVLTSYLTYQAMRTVLMQLRENDPGKAIWLSGFSSSGKLQDGEAYLEEMLQTDREMALRIMTVREHLAEEVVDFLPEMVRTGIQEANIGHRRRLLERLTQVQPTSEVAHSEELVEPDSDTAGESAADA